MITNQQPFFLTRCKQASGSKPPSSRFKGAWAELICQTSSVTFIKSANQSSIKLCLTLCYLHLSFWITKENIMSMLSLILTNRELALITLLFECVCVQLFVFLCQGGCTKWSLGYAIHFDTARNPHYIRWKTNTSVKIDQMYHQSDFGFFRLTVFSDSSQDVVGKGTTRQHSDAIRRDTKRHDSL